MPALTSNTAVEYALHCTAEDVKTYCGIAMFECILHAQSSDPTYQARGSYSTVMMKMCAG